MPKKPRILRRWDISPRLFCECKEVGKGIPGGLRENIGRNCRCKLIKSWDEYYKKGSMRGAKRYRGVALIEK